MQPAYAFERDELVIGRDRSCAIALDDHATSRQHARVVNRDGTWTIVDLGSRNGTFVDGQRARETPLESLAEVRIGDSLFKFVDRDAEQYGRFRLDGAVDGALPAAVPSLAGGYSIRRFDAELERVAPTQLSCVILGETGTGKEVFARELHRLSGRPGSFSAIHCAAIPQALFESELFGHRRGAFSGALRDKAGLVQQAHRGTLFLDEIGDMPLDAQVKLLRVLQTHEVVPVGGTQPEHVDLRVVCATHRDLYRLVQEGKFRADLFARVNEYVMVLPPLRERKEDVYLLTQAFLARQTRRLEPSFDFMVALLKYDWPLNVRELEGAVRRAAALAQGGVLEPQHLPQAVLEEWTLDPSAEGALRAATGPGRARPEEPADGFLRGPPTEEKMRELLARHGGNVAAVGRELGKGRMQVHRWVRRYGLVLDDFRSR